jgi:hypothetical protein
MKREVALSMKRILLFYAAVAMLVLVLAAPMATGQTAPPAPDPAPGTTKQDPSQGKTEKKPSKDQNLADLTAAWWNWAVQNPSPLVGNYEGGEQCETVTIDGVEYIFLAGTTGGEAERTCTVPAGTPILFPVVNAVCSEAFTPPDPAPYPRCAERLIDQALEDGEIFATLDGKDLKTQRITSETFTWVLPPDNVFGLPEGSYDAGSSGLWVYEPKGLKPGEYDLTFGGSFFGGGFTVDVTYHLIVV